MARDNQRQRVYDAERSVPGFQVPYDEKGMTVAETQRFVNSIIDSAWWWNRSRIRTITVKDGRGTRRGLAGRDLNGYFINIPRWARTKWVVIHELAHHLTNSQHRDVASHGPEFAANMLILTTRYIGTDEAKLLKEAYRAHRVKARRPTQSRVIRKGCAFCGKMVTERSAVRAEGGPYYFCSKDHAQKWFSARLTKR